MEVVSCVPAKRSQNNYSYEGTKGDLIRAINQNLKIASKLIFHMQPLHLDALQASKIHLNIQEMKMDLFRSFDSVHFVGIRFEPDQTSLTSKWAVSVEFQLSH